MATLVEDGFRRAPVDRVMHPFFRQSTGGFAREEGGHCRQQQAHRQTSLDPSVHAAAPQTTLDDTEPEPSNMTLQPDLTYVQHDGTREADSEDIDLNIDRRKRRKITPTSPSADSTKVEPRSWIEELEQAASERASHSNQTRVTSVDDAPSHQVKEGGVDLTNKPHAVSPTTPPATPHNTAIDLELADGTEGQQTTPDAMAKRAGSTLVSASKRKKNNVAPKSSPRRNTRQTRNLTFKNGRLASSLILKLPYKDSAKDSAAFGEKIDAILQGPQKKKDTAHEDQSLSPKQDKKPAASSKTLHPFFMGKAAPKQQAAPEIATGTESTDSTQHDVKPQPSAAKPWSDLGFGSTKQSRAKDVSASSISAPWPPLELQSVGTAQPSTASQSEIRLPIQLKHKSEVVRVSLDDSILDEFADGLTRRLSPSTSLVLPSQWRTNGKQLFSELHVEEAAFDEQAALTGLQERILRGQSSFDRGLPAGPLDWVHEYAPKRAAEVLQPECNDLRSWLEQLKVHHVQSKLSNRGSDKTRPKKKRPKKRASDLDDFLVPSDDEDDSQAPVKNATIICGPSGCGKTASVFAVAQELDFEVFEIHSGMRRTAKDIFDRVGDMTHNHLVQTKTSASRSRASSVLSDAHETADEAPQPDPKQKSLAAFVGKKLLQNNDTEPRLSDVKKDSQRQSLILLEEVDVLFEEDKTFWSGVQTLIATSKRPIILTCNSLDEIPMAEIEVAAVLHYSAPAVHQAVEHLVHLAACEGHLIEREALRTLYLSRGQDLRAALTDLNFWCQMTVGSTMGGLDWMYHDRNSASDDISNGSRRIVSKGTFQDALHLVPDQSPGEEELLAFAQSSLDVSIIQWEENRPWLSFEVDAERRLHQLQQTDNFSDYRSCMDLFDDSVHPLLSSAISKLHPSIDRPVNRKSLTEFILRRPNVESIRPKNLSDALEPLVEDLRTFPPPTGRTAPSLDGLSTTIATDIAPYIRHIVLVDEQIERQRQEIDASSQGTGRLRKTRRARAALEGGNVANTRVERWFPKDLDFVAVMATGGQWYTSVPLDVVRPVLSRESTATTVVTDVAGSVDTPMME